MTSPRQDAAMIRRTLPQRRAAETSTCGSGTSRSRSPSVSMPTARRAKSSLTAARPGTTSSRSRATPACCSASRSSTGFPLKQFATPSPAARRKSPRRFWARSLIPSQRNHFREASDGCWPQDFSDTANWQTPQELPDLRRVGIVALDTETNDEGLRADRGSAWPWRDGHVCGISVAWRADGEMHAIYIPVAPSRHRQFRSRSGLSLAQGSGRIRRPHRHP